MISPILSPIRQAFAQGQTGVLNAFAMQILLGDCFPAGQSKRVFGLRCPSCYPSPSLRSGPSQAGPVPLPKGGVRVSSKARNCFEIRDIPLESGSITTTQRGSSPCGSRLPSSPFSPRSLLDACRIRPRAGLQVPLAGRSSLTLWTKTCWPVPRSAALQVLPLAESSSACRPATPAIERLTERPAFGRTRSNQGATRAYCPGGVSVLRA